VSFESLDFNDIGYIVQIHSDISTLHDLQGSFAAPEVFEPEPVVMTSQNGKRFNCYMPSSSLDETHPAISQGEPTLDELAEMVKASTSKCLRLPAVSTSAWVWEVCPSVLVRKVQVEADPDQPPVHQLWDTAEYTSHELRDGHYLQHFQTPDAAQSFALRFECGSSDAVLSLTSRSPERGAVVWDGVITLSTLCAPDADGSEALHQLHRLLKPLMQPPSCVKKNEGWWTYEFCFGSSIRQYHRDANGQLSTEYKLGRYVEGPARKSSLSYEFLDGGHEDVKRAVYVEEYVEGTPCEETQLRRSTRVMFFCNSLSASNVILSVKETQTCQYTMKVLSHAVCSHPHFAADSGEGALSSTRSIHCLPRD
jgi:hypothetical protein